MRFRRNAIRWKLSLAAGAAVGVLGTIFVAGAYGWFRTTLMTDVQDFAAHEVDEVAEAVRGARSVAEILERREVLDRLLREDGVLSVDLWTLDGERVYRLPDSEGPLSAPWPEGFAAAREGRRAFLGIRQDAAPVAIRAARLIREEGEPRWIATTSVRRDRADAALTSFLLTCGGGVCLAVLAAFACSAVVVSRALRPVHDLVRDVEIISREGPGRRLVVSPPGSELGRLARLLNRMLEETERTVDRLKRFTAHAGHELRTPLARIRAEAESALAGGDAAASRAALEGVLEELDALRRVIDGLLELARGEEPVLRDTPPLELSELVRELSTEAALVGHERGVEVELLAAPTARVRGSRTLLARAIWNLIDNALRFSPEGGRVRMRLVAPTPGEVAVEIEDEGPGLGEDPERLFEPFARGEAQPATGAGYGLGLALTRAVAHRHGGSLRVMPPGELRGARLRLVLPLAGMDSEATSLDDPAADGTRALDARRPLAEGA